MIFTYDDTTKETTNLEGKIVIVSADWFKDEYRNAENQLFKAKGGFGCDPTKLGRAVFGNFYDGETCRVNREYILGVASEKAISDWEKMYGRSRNVFKEVREND